MVSDIFLQRGLPVPPDSLDEKFFDWLWEVGKLLEVTFFDDSPMPLTDFEKLTRQLGDPHPDLKYFYARCTPWGAQRDGVEIWNGHVKLIHERTITNVLNQDIVLSEDIETALTTSPALWPVHVSQNANVAAFSDDRGRLAILNANIGLNLGCPLALGLRNYIVMAVVGEIRWEEENYRTYDAVLDDVTVRSTGAWPYEDPPRHPLIDVYEALKAFRIS